VTTSPTQQMPQGDATRDATANATGARRVRVMQVITHLDLGGAESVTMQLIESLHTDIDFSVFAVLRAPELNGIGRDMLDRLRGWGVPVTFGVGGKFKSGGVVLAAFRLSAALRRQRPDVVHLHTEIPELTFAVARTFSARARRTPLLRTVHNCALWIDWSGIGRWVTTALMEGRLAKGCTVAVSRAAAEADAAIATRLSRAPASIIHNGVALPDAAPPRRGEGDVVRIVFAGRLVHQKGADLLPGILASAHRRARPRLVDIVVAGEGDMADRLAAMFALDLPGWTVRMVPPIERLHEQLGFYDGVLLPSRFEGFGLLQIETVLAGIPLVTTDAPGLNEMMPEGYPLIAAVDDVEALGAHFARVIDAPARYRALVGCFVEPVAARFSPAATARAYALQYAALAGLRGDAA
jgi:glycosyltransferase involved in cell wall biosynthesis